MFSLTLTHSERGQDIEVGFLKRQAFFGFMAVNLVALVCAYGLFFFRFCTRTLALQSVKIGQELIAN